jgi:dTDP-4-amino-4,6-dideoxygalactose transaminase
LTDGLEATSIGVTRRAADRRLEREIEAVMMSRLGRTCLFFPSGRLALYVALRAWLSPGQRILMSPLTDDVIFFVVLAAGLKPIMAPVSSDDGNIDPELVPGDVWPRLAAVLTTNLYGVPDRVQELRSRCDRLKIPLIEDAAHAIETEVDGRLIGTFGDVAAFSLSKHVAARGGGVLAFDGDQADRSELEELRDAAIVPARPHEQLIRAGSDAAEKLVIALRLVWPVRRLRRTLRLVERRGYRMPLRAPELRYAVSAAPDLAAFHSWVRVDRPHYRSRLSNALLADALRRLHRLDAERSRRIQQVDRLRALPTAAAAVKSGDAQPLFRVPLLVDDRPAVLGKLERRILGTGYIYDPPLDRYAGAEFAEPSNAPEAAQWWASHVVPVDPMEADAVMRVLRA